MRMLNVWAQNGPFAQIRIFSENLLMSLDIDSKMLFKVNYLAADKSKSFTCKSKSTKAVVIFLCMYAQLHIIHFK